MEDGSESDQLAAEITAAVGAAALGVGTAVLTNPAGGVMVSAAAVPAIKAALDRVFGLRGRQVAAMCELAAQAAEESLDELLERVTADRHRAQLLSAAVRAAANTALESKLKVLGRLLVQGLLNNQAEVDEARLLTFAIEEVERLHLRVLAQLTQSFRETLSDEERTRTDYPEGEPTDAWPFDRLAEELGVSRSTLEVVLGVLFGRGLVHGTADAYGMPAPPQMEWSLTEPGRVVLEHFREAGEAAAGSPVPEHDQRAARNEGGDIE